MTFSPRARERAAGGRRQPSRTRSLSAKQREAQEADVQVTSAIADGKGAGARKTTDTISAGGETTTGASAGKR
jgi:hypothetical protein